MELTPQTIREVEFREKLRGYHPDDVDAFVERVAATIEALQQRVQELEGGTRGEEGVSDDVIRRTLVMAQRTADMVLSEAQESANKTLGDARLEADRLVGEARADAERVAAEAEGQLGAELARLSEARTKLEGDVGALQEYAGRLKERLREALLDQLQALDAGITPTDPRPVLSDAGDFALPPADDDAEASEDAPDRRLRGAASAASDEPGESGGGGDIDMVARARQMASLVPGSGEEDPFLEELRRAVDEPDAPGEPTQAHRPATARDPIIDARGETLSLQDEFAELRGIPEGGRLSGRLFRRR